MPIDIRGRRGPTSSFDTFLFDLDGTLIDSLELILRSYRHTAERHLRMGPVDDLFWKKELGTPLRRQFRALTTDEVLVETMVTTYVEFNHLHHDTLLREFPGVLEAVRALKDRGADLGIVTSKKRAGTLRGLTRCRLEGLFEVVVAADDVERHKPDPFPVARAVELLGARLERTVFIGDSPHDMAAGKAAGVATAAALWGPFLREELEPQRPDFWLAAPADITAL